MDKYITVNNFIKHLWYMTDIIILSEQTFDKYRISPDAATLKNHCIYSGKVYQLKDEEVLNQWLDSAGIVDGYIIIII